MAEGQLALRFPFRPSLGADDFLPHDGAAVALEFLRATSSWPGGQLALWGESGVGKTHLVHLWAEECGARLLQGGELGEPIWPDGPIAVDDADHAPAEAALLHLLNAAAETRHPLLLATTPAPGRIRCRLPDLASRLRAIAAVEIEPGDDAFLATLFARLLAERQLAIPAAVQGWVLTHLPRTPAAMRAAAARLDEATLAERKTVTQKFAESMLSDLLARVTEDKL